MSALSLSLASSLQGKATTLALLWRLERADGAVFGFTDHDADLLVEGLTYRARSAVASEGVVESLQRNADTTEMKGALQSDVIAEADLMSGVWDDARVTLQVVNWADTSQRAHMFSGYIGAVRMEAGAFTAALAPLREKLAASGGRFFARLCDARLGDGRCRVDLTTPAMRGTGVVQSVDGRSVRVSGLSAFQQGWFDLGVLTAPSGERRLIRSHRIDAAVAWLDLDEALTQPLTVGASVVVTAGCDKRAATCATKFANIQNFRGFPHMMGAETVIGGVDASQPLDGASRWKR